MISNCHHHLESRTLLCLLEEVCLQTTNTDVRTMTAVYYVQSCMSNNNIFTLRCLYTCADLKEKKRF